MKTLALFALFALATASSFEPDNAVEEKKEAHKVPVVPYGYPNYYVASPYHPYVASPYNYYPGVASYVPTSYYKTVPSTYSAYSYGSGYYPYQYKYVAPAGVPAVHYVP